MNKLIIDMPEKIEGDIEDFKLDCVDESRNYTATKIKLCRDPESAKPVLFYSQELSRNFRDKTDPFGKRHVMKVFTPSNLEAVVDSTLENKFNDTVLAFKNQIHDYAPLTDIHSEKMNLFMDEDTATFISDIGINIDGFGEDFTEMESVESNPFLDDLSENATMLKIELNDLLIKQRKIKKAMVEEVNEIVDLDNMSDEQFELFMVREKIPERLIQPYLIVKEDIDRLKMKLKTVNNEVFVETKSKITLPKLLEEKLDDLIMK